MIRIYKHTDVQMLRPYVSLWIAELRDKKAAPCNRGGV
jgi:hypothetical protein